MEIVFVSNLLNHHQLSFCQSLRARCDSFFFIATDPSDEGHGYQSRVESDFVIRWFDAAERTLAEEKIKNADAVLFGACPNALIALRMNENKLSFLFSERFFKKGVWRRWIPRTRKAVRQRIADYRDRNIHVLCASAYLPYDLSFFRFPKEKIYQWGYFPAPKSYDDIDSLMAAKQPASILWVARMIDCKHPEAAVQAAKRLKAEGYRFTLDMIGDGSMYASVKQMIEDNDLSDCVRLLGSLKPEEVRRHMEQSEIFLFTSDRREGWGAVLNESMNSGCAVVASHAIGSVPFLLKDRENGLVYQSGDADGLYRNVKHLLDHPDERAAYGKRAYQTVAGLWNAEVAAERFAQLASAILANGASDLFADGPCSHAKIIKENGRIR